MSADNLSADLALAHELADIASKVSLGHFRRDPKHWTKSDGSIATEADVAVETAIRARLAQDRASDAILGEEQGAAGAGPRRWIIDAIDGTIDFQAGGPNWGTLIALEIDGRVAVGVCDEPVHKRRYFAARGQGAFCAILSAGNSTPHRLHVSTAATLADARSFVPPAMWLRTDRMRAVADTVVKSTKALPHTDHPALQVAAGTSDVAFFAMAGPWDLAAPLLVVEEAGGRFTDLDGKYDWTTGTAVFSNGVLHDDFIRLVR